MGMSEPVASPHAPVVDRSSGTSTTVTARVLGLEASGWVLVGLLGTLFSLALQPAVDPDLGWHLGTGRWIVQQGRIPFTDPFSWSVPGRKWIAHEWLTEVAMHSVRSVGGDPLLIVMWAGIITATWGVLHRTARILGASRSWAGWVTALGAISTIRMWGVRPQMITFFLTAYVGMRLQRWTRAADRRGRLPWELAPLTALWVNLHGGYIFGIVMVGVFACGATGERLISRLNPRRAARPTWKATGSLWALFGGCLAASLCSPNTLDGLIYPFTYLGDNASTRYVGEWFRPDYSKPQFWPFALLLAASVPAMVIGFRRRLIGLTEVGLVVPFAVLGAQSMRNISLFVVCAVPVFAAVVSELLRERALSRSQRIAAKLGRGKLRRTGQSSRTAITRQLTVLIVAAVASIATVSSVAMAQSSISAQGNANARASLLPVAAAQWLADHPGGKVFNHYNYGGWLVLQQVPVFIDGRPDMYGDTFMDEYVRITGSGATTHWQQSMQGVGAARVLMPISSPMAKQIASDIAAGKAPGWSEPTSDRVARLFVRR